MITIKVEVGTRVFWSMLRDEMVHERFKKDVWKTAKLLKELLPHVKIHQIVALQIHE